jgi:hypothetical protein
MKIPTLHFPKIVLPRIVSLILFVAVLTGSVVTGVYFYRRAVTAEAIIKDPTKLGKEEGKRLIESVRKLMEIPADEEPTIATVADASKLKDQAFFANSQNGDKVIVYTKARKAILYRPTTNKIIDVAPVTIGDSAGQPPVPEEQTALPPPPVLQGSAVILNGTGIVGLTKKIEEQVKTSFPGVTIVAKDNAVGRAYAKTIVVDGKGTNQELARAVAEALDASLSGLPEKEATPTSDIVIIVGEDKK